MTKDDAILTLRLVISFCLWLLSLMALSLGQSDIGDRILNGYRKPFPPFFFFARCSLGQKYLWHLTRFLSGTLGATWISLVVFSPYQIQWWYSHRILYQYKNDIFFMIEQMQHAVSLSSTRKSEIVSNILLETVGFKILHFS